MTSQKSLPKETGHENMIYQVKIQKQAFKNIYTARVVSCIHVF